MYCLHSILTIVIHLLSQTESFCFVIIYIALLVDKIQNKNEDAPQKSHMNNVFPDEVFDKDLSNIPSFEQFKRN